MYVNEVLKVKLRLFIIFKIKINIFWVLMGNWLIYNSFRGYVVYLVMMFNIVII